MAVRSSGGGDLQVPLVAAKLVPPVAHVAHIVRSRLVERVLGAERVSLLVAQPGYGKTVVARQVIEAGSPCAGWLSVDRLDEHRGAFWLHFHAAVRAALPAIDIEPERLLIERGADDPLHLAALLAQLEQIDQPGVLVLDDVDRVTDPGVVDALATLVERAGDRLRLVLTARFDPPLPLARWRAANWLVELRAEDLRFGDDEALALGRTVDRTGAFDDHARELHLRTAGWPIAFHAALALVLQHGVEGAALSGHSDVLLSEYLITEVLDRLPEPVATTALQLSVLERFDLELCRQLLGPAAVASLIELWRRRVFLVGVGGIDGVLEFQPLIRELLGQVLELRDPEGRIELHRKAADIFEQRGEIARSLRHLHASGDDESVGHRVLTKALQLVDRGDREALTRLLSEISPTIVVHPRAALAVGTACLFGGWGTEAIAWRERAESLGAAQDPTAGAELEALSAAIALFSARLDEAWIHLKRRFVYDPVEVDGPLDSRIATTAARITLGREDRESSRHWVSLARGITSPVTVASVTVPALEAWLALEEGQPDRATPLALGAVRQSELFGTRPAHGPLEALVVAAWCLLARGEITEAAALADLARLDADALGWPWSRYRATLVAAEVKRLQGDVAQASALLSQLGERMPLDGLLARRHRQATIRVLLTGGRFTSARRLLVADEDDPRSRLLAARLALHERASTTVVDLLADHAGWDDTAARFEAQLLLAVTAPVDDGRRLLADGVAAAAEMGWSSPFLGHSRQVNQLLTSLPLATLHPRLARALDAAGPPSTADSRPETLTERELTLLELLPTHLSYAEMGAELFLSVNTVKSNLKSVYRKLGASSRSGAIAEARRRGLL
jgi:LuxR family transcriptional regulator, maltose regulon positive regulatory protein